MNNEMEFLKNKAVLITGANGYLGSAFVSKIVGTELEELCLMVKTNNFNFNLNKKVTIFEGDISEKNLWDSVFKNRFDFIFHFAGENISQENIGEIFKSNFYSSIKFVESYLESNSRAKVVYLSSSNISGSQNEITINENTHDDLYSEWSASKKMSEMIFHLSKYKGFKCVSLRLPNVYGASSNMATFNRMSINKMIEIAFSRKILTLYSNHRLKRSFVHISDVIDSIFKAAKHFEALTEREFYYVGSEEFHSYGDLAEILREIFHEKGIHLSISHDFNRLMAPIEMRAGRIDSSNFREITSWKSIYKLENGLLQAVNDYSESRNPF